MSEEERQDDQSASGGKSGFGLGDVDVSHRAAGIGTGLFVVGVLIGIVIGGVVLPGTQQTPGAEAPSELETGKQETIGVLADKPDEPAPFTDFDFCYNASEQRLQVTYEEGEQLNGSRVFVKRTDGPTERFDGNLRVGGSVVLSNVTHGEEVRVVWEAAGQREYLRGYHTDVVSGTCRVN